MAHKPGIRLYHSGSQPFDQTNEFLPELLSDVYMTLCQTHVDDPGSSSCDHSTFLTDVFPVRLSTHTAVSQACAHIGFGSLLTDSIARASSTTVRFSRSATPFCSGSYGTYSNSIIPRSLRTPELPHMRTPCHHHIGTPLLCVQQSILHSGTCVNSWELFYFA